MEAPAHHVLVSYQHHCCLQVPTGRPPLCPTAPASKSVTWAPDHRILGLFSKLALNTVAEGCSFCLGAQTGTSSPRASPGLPSFLP
jgi:hypothetical protein